MRGSRLRCRLALITCWPMSAAFPGPPPRRRLARCCAKRVWPPWRAAHFSARDAGRICCASASPSRMPPSTKPARGCVSSRSRLSPIAVERKFPMRQTSLALAAFALAIALAPAGLAHAQTNAAQQKTAQQLDREGLWEGYDGEWHHTSYELLALAEAIPAKDYAWRPAPGVRSTSETFMHIVYANFWLLSLTGQPMPADLKPDAEKTVTSKADVVAWLQ